MVPRLFDIIMKGFLSQNRHYTNHKTKHIQPTVHLVQIWDSYLEFTSESTLIYRINVNT